MNRNIGFLFLLILIIAAFMVLGVIIFSTSTIFTAEYLWQRILAFIIYTLCTSGVTFVAGVLCVDIGD